jgi:hypothetical protein
MEFRCNLYANSNDSILCMNSNSTCSVSVEGKQSCVCPPGYVHDYTMLHNDNCSMPENYLLGLFIFCTIAYSLSALKVLLKIPKIKKASRKLAWMFFFCLFFQWFWILAFYIESGSYETQLFFTFIWGQLTTFISVDIAIASAAPVFATLAKPIEPWKRFFYGVTIILSTAFFGMTIVVMCFARYPAEIYNQVFTAYIFFLVVNISTLTGIVCLKVLQLKWLLLQVITTDRGGATSSLDEYNKVIKKLNSILMALVAFLNLSISGNIVLVILVLVLGSFPMNYVFLTLMACSIWPLTPMFLDFLGEMKSSGSTYAVSSLHNGTVKEGSRAGQQ